MTLQTIAAPQGGLDEKTRSSYFSLYVRAYWPKAAAVLDGSWTPPAVIKIS